MRQLSLSALALLVVTFAMAAGSPQPPDTVTVRQANVQGTEKPVLATARGLTLYYDAKDSAGSATCTGGCAKIWPPLLLGKGSPSGPASVASGLAAFRGADGRQVEYRGHPLYTFVKDRAPGEAKGAGLYPRWHVATPSIPRTGSNAGSTGSHNASASTSGTAGANGYGSGGSGSAW